MPVRDIFDKPFDEGTVVKLEIFQKYFEEWLPTFVMGSYSKAIQVFDLFAGSGYDEDGVPGSTIRILEVINRHRANLAQKNKQVFLFLNDADRGKVELLKTNVENKMAELSLDSLVVPRFSSQDFRECLLTTYAKELVSGSNLIFIDQNGFKQVDEKVFGFLVNLETTEFMFFVSSSFIHRFAKRPEVKKYHPKFDAARIVSVSRKKVHNVICEEFEKYVPSNITSYALLPFSIMKSDKNNVYGLIFVSKHPRGADKFLQTVWKENAINGNANFDIEEESKKAQLDLFDGRILTKIESFQKELRQKILNGEIANNIQAFYFTLNHGHIGQHASEEIKRMKKEGLIAFDSPSPLVTYDKVEKERRVLEYKLVKK